MTDHMTGIYQVQGDFYKFKNRIRSLFIMGIVIFSLPVFCYQGVTQITTPFFDDSFFVRITNENNSHLLIKEGEKFQKKEKLKFSVENRKGKFEIWNLLGKRYQVEMNGIRRDVNLEEEILLTEEDTIESMIFYQIETIGIIKIVTGVYRFEFY